MMPVNGRDMLERANTLIKDKLMNWMTAPGDFDTALAGFRWNRRGKPHHHENRLYPSQILVVVQGRKNSRLGNEEYVYGANACLVIGLDMPSASHVYDVSPDQPFLSLSLRLDKSLVNQLMAESPRPLSPDVHSAKGIAMGQVDGHILDAFHRLTELVENHSQIPVLAPLIIREIHYRLLEGPLGDHIRDFSTAGTQCHQISQAVTWLRSNYGEPLKIEELAAMVNMGTSTFHRHFKKVTSLSPLQFQKRLRLYEAQRLMLTDNQDASRAALAVGYESPTQFNREYKRLFGEPPLRNISRIQHQPRAAETIPG